MSLAASLRTAPMARFVEWFAVANVGFLGVDIAIAHAENHYARSEEWLPVGFSAVATALLAPGLFGERLRAATRRLWLAVGAAAIFVGIGGMVLHLGSAFFVEQTLANLVYAAPFVAPLSYVGVGLLVVLVRLEDDEPVQREWVLLLALGGFVGNLGLSLLDHAQNGFFSPAEWVAVGAAAFGVSFLALALARPRDLAFTRVCLAVLALEVVIGFAGFALHLVADARRPGPPFAKLVHGAPVFAPLLFADLALLAALPLFARLRAR